MCQSVTLQECCFYTVSMGLRDSSGSNTHAHITVSVNSSFPTNNTNCHSVCLCAVSMRLDCLKDLGYVMGATVFSPLMSLITRKLRFSNSAAKPAAERKMEKNIFA